MKDILWLIVRTKEQIKILFKVNFIEWFILKRIMKKKKIEFIKNKQKLKGYAFDGVIIDEFIKLKW